MKIEDILSGAYSHEKTYSMFATHDGVEWFQLHARKGEYQSPKKLIAALNATAFPPDFKKYKGLKLVEYTKVVTTLEMDVNEFINLK